MSLIDFILVNLIIGNEGLSGLMRSIRWVSRGGSRHSVIEMKEFRLERIRDGCPNSGNQAK